MPTVNIYLTFDGNCEEAFNFYQSVFGGEFENLSRFGEMPPQEDMPPVPEEIKDQLMHVSLPISKETVLMGSDKGGGWSPDLKPGNNFSISVNTETKEEAERIMNTLAEGGNVTMPFDKTFWDSWFGMFTDRFGINWMVNAPIS